MFFQEKKVYNNGIDDLVFCQNGTITLDDKPYEPRKNKQGYAVITKVINEIYASDKTCHTIMNFLFLPRFPACPLTDHWDGNRMNFHLQNLNPCSTSVNNINKTKAKGYDPINDEKYRDSPEMMFQSRIRFKGKRFKLGQFVTKEEAYNRTKGSRMMLYWRQWSLEQTQIEKSNIELQYSPEQEKRILEKTIVMGRLEETKMEEPKMEEQKMEEQKMDEMVMDLKITQETSL